MMVMGFACCGDFISSSALGVRHSAFGVRQITPANFNTPQSVLTFGPLTSKFIPTGLTGKVKDKSAYEPSGPSGRSLSRFP